MKRIAISLWQPWASAIACGLKQIETRSWAAECVGTRIVIHAGKRCTGAQKDWWMRNVKGDAENPLRQMNRNTFELCGIRDFVDLPFGAMVAEADLIGVERAAELMAGQRVTELEAMWGDFSDIDAVKQRPRYGWLLANVRRFDKPIPAKGWQNFFTWDPDTNETIGLAPSWKGEL